MPEQFCAYPRPLKVKVKYVGVGTWEATCRGRVVRAQSPDKAKWRVLEKVRRKGAA